MKPKQAKRFGMGLIGTLTLILIVLKAFGLIDVSWLWVFSPLWISALLALLIFGIILAAGRMKRENGKTEKTGFGPVFLPIYK